MAAQRGADVWAVDASAAMVAKTRELLSEVLGTQEATRRVRVGEMRDLRPEADASFDLVLALGVFQDAQDSAEWHATLAEAARVLRVGGLCLVANFGPGSQPAGRPLTPVPGERDVWQGYCSEDRRMTLPKPEDLDADFARHGLKTLLPTERVHVKTARGYHFTLNALYLRE
ncbi:MAG TPA: class I SAM-dependent methyltransferase [Trueperaceae bacterium]|nr:class I SAM-dependent methyltransferase [Trueperaceae bacterium]